MILRPVGWGCAGAVGLFIGFPNPLWQMPLAALLFPLALTVLGLGAQSKAQAFQQGWLTGLAGASAALYWIALPLHNVGMIPWIFAVPCAMALGAYVGLYAGLFSLVAFQLRQHPPFIRAMELGLVWYLLEFVRGFLFTGFSWLSLSTAFVPWPAFLQGASVLGGYALGGLFVTLLCWLCAPLLPPNAAQERADKRSLWQAHTRNGLAGASLLGLLLLGGYVHLRQQPVITAKTPDVLPVIFVEGNIDQNQKWEAAHQKSTVELYTRLTQKALQEHDGPPPLVVWPETAMPFYYQEHSLYNPALRNFATEHGITLVLGAPGYRKNAAERRFQIFNRAYLVSPSGSEAGFYEKEHLVPFGEYLPPLLAFDFLKPLLQGVGDFTVGTAVAPLQTGDLSLGMLICYESIFPELAQERVRQGANILLNISNDGWFGESSAAEQHLQLAAVRSVEQGRWLLRGTNTGISAVFDHVGRLVARGGQFTAQAVPAFMQLRTQTTPYHALAPWLPWLALGLFVFLFMLAHFRRV